MTTQIHYNWSGYKDNLNNSKPNEVKTNERKDLIPTTRLNKIRLS